MPWKLNRLKQTWCFILSVRPSIYHRIFLRRSQAGAHPSCPQARGGVHPLTQPEGSLESTIHQLPINAFKLSLDCETESKRTLGECAHTTQKSPWPPGDSNPEPPCCEETVLTAALLSQSCKYCHSSPSSASNQASVSRMPHPRMNMHALLPVNMSDDCFGKLQPLISLHCIH